LIRLSLVGRRVVAMVLRRARMVRARERGRGLGLIYLKRMKRRVTLVK